MVIYGILFKKFKKNNDPNDEEQNLRDFYNARAISFGIFIGMIALFYLPIIVWKWIGRRRMTVLLNRWAYNDENMRGTMTFMPRWTVQMPSIFKSTTIVRITTPPGARPSVFQQGAYVPAVSSVNYVRDIFIELTFCLTQFVNGPRDTAAGAYFYPYGPGQPGVPRMSVVGNFHNDTNGPPAYSGLGDYKGGYGDVKL